MPEQHCRLDASAGRIVRLPSFSSGGSSFVACFDEETALVITDDGRSLARARFGSDELEILFPR